jgi:hypothetical protein
MKTVIEIRCYGIDDLYEVFVNNQYICCGERRDIENIARRLQASILDSLLNTCK